MNHLAHLFLAPDSPQARIGSVLGDFIRGLDTSTLPEPVRYGIRHHLAVDGFTDKHPEVLASKQLFSKERRRFAGVALDILYDHYLLKYWPQFTDTDCDGFVQRVYEELETNEHLMPPKMITVTRRMVSFDWFGAYQELDSIGMALDRVAERVRFPNRFQGIIHEIRDHNAQLEAHFLEFFPELQSFAREI